MTAAAPAPEVLLDLCPADVTLPGGYVHRKVRVVLTEGRMLVIGPAEAPIVIADEPTITRPMLAPSGHRSMEDATRVPIDSGHAVVTRYNGCNCNLGALRAYDTAQVLGG
jgi:hypothetical protein